MACVSRLTGFPEEMLDMEMDMESDLGIDSIKRVEIMSELEKVLPQAASLSPDNMSSLKTLKDVMEAISSSETLPQELELPGTPLNGGGTPGAATAAAGTTGPLPVLEVVMATISELTGFPVEMLEPGMDLESDLGIDSIKRVEILSRLETALPETAAISPDEMAGIKTLEQISMALASDASDQKRVSPPGKATRHPGETPPPPPATGAAQLQTTSSESPGLTDLKKKILKTGHIA